MRRWFKLAAILIGGFGLCVFGVAYQGPSEAGDPVSWCRVLSNATLIPGVLFSGVSALAWIAGEGTFDGIRYSMSSLLARIRGTDKRYATYLDYLRREKRKGTGGRLLLIVGLAFLGTSVLFTILYYLLK